MGEILTPIAFQIELLRLTDGTLAANKRRGHPADIAKGRKAAERAEKALDAHDAALRAEVERLKKALAACTERLRHLHGLRMEGEPKALDFSHEFVLIRKARTANLSAPAEEEGRDAR